MGFIVLEYELMFNDPLSPEILGTLDWAVYLYSFAFDSLKYAKVLLAGITFYINFCLVVVVVGS